MLLEVLLSVRMTALLLRERTPPFALLAHLRPHLVFLLLLLDFHGLILELAIPETHIGSGARGRFGETRLLAAPSPHS